MCSSDLRLHITIEELNDLIEQVHNDRVNKENRATVPLHVIATKPAQAVEHYKHLMGQIHQLALMADANQFEAAARESDRLSSSELALWQQIQSGKRS